MLLCEENGGDGIPVCIVLVHILLSCNDLVDGADFRTRGGVPPRTFKLLRDCSPTLGKPGDESCKRKNTPLLNVSFSSAISMIAGAFCMTETSQGVQKLVLPDLSAFLHATQPLWANLYSQVQNLQVNDWTRECLTGHTLYGFCHNTSQELHSNPCIRPSGSPVSNRY